MKILSPSKHSHPDRTVVAVSVLLLRRLRAKNLESFDSLRHYVIAKAPDCDALFLPAMHFLFLLGLVDYSAKNDSFRFVREK